MKTKKTHDGKHEYVRVSVWMKIEGKTVRRRQRTYLHRGSEGSAFTLEELGQILFMWEKMFPGGSTYVMDGVLQDLEKIMPKKDNETAQSVFEKYWLRTNETITKDFEEQNAGIPGEYSFFKAEGDYLKFCLANIINSFDKSALPVKHGFLYWFYKYVFQGSFEDMKKDLDNTPDSIKKLIDSNVKQ